MKTTQFHFDHSGIKSVKRKSVKPRSNVFNIKIIVLNNGVLIEYRSGYFNAFIKVFHDSFSSGNFDPAAFIHTNRVQALYLPVSSWYYSSQGKSRCALKLRKFPLTHQLKLNRVFSCGLWNTYIQTYLLRTYMAFHVTVAFWKPTTAIEVEIASGEAKTRLVDRLTINHAVFI